MAFEFVPFSESKEELAVERLSGKQAILLKRLKERYTADLIRTVLVPLILKTGPVSLRSLDWAVVNHSKEKNTVCSSSTPGVYVSIHRSYQEALRFWKRRLFDPFRRRHPLQVRIDGEVYWTTFGQANFSLFVVENGILSFVIRNIADIEGSMNMAAARQRDERARAEQEGRKRRRSELTKSASPPLVLYRSVARVRL